MWPFKPTLTSLPGDSRKFKISGMHCSSCAMNIDNSVEEIPGVISSKTNYAKGETEVVFESDKVNQPLVVKAIKALGYEVLK